MINVLNAGLGPVSSSHVVSNIKQNQLSCSHKLFTVIEHSNHVEINVTWPFMICCTCCINFTKT